MIRITILTVLAFLSSATILNAGTLPSTDHDLLVTPEIWRYDFVAIADDARASLVNPAGLGVGRRPNGFVSASSFDGGAKEVQILAQTPAGGLGFRRAFDVGNGYQTNVYTYSLGYEVRPGLSLGFTNRWLRSNLGPNPNGYSLDIGGLFRPSNLLSLGAVMRNVNQTTLGDRRLESSYVYGIALRPFTNRVSFSIEGRATEDNGLKSADYRYGLEVELIEGIFLNGCMDEDDLNLGIRLNVPLFGLGYSSRFGRDGHRTQQSFTACFRMERMRTVLYRRDRFAEIEIGGRLEDEGSGFVLLGPETKGGLAIIGEIRKAAQDKDIRGIILRVKNIDSGFIGGLGGLLQEIRGELVKAKQKGKIIVTYLEIDASLPEMYIASASDRIVMPALANVYGLGVSLEIKRLKSMFEKFGIEWDYRTAGKYKSTFLPLFTDSATTGQAEEINSLVEDIYDQFVEALAEGRGFSKEEAEEIANGGLMSAKEAKKKGLIDEIG